MTELDKKSLSSLGLYVHGEYVGTKRGKDKVDRDTGVVTPVYFLGVKIPKKGGFDDESQYIEIKLTKDQVNFGWINRLDESKGKSLAIPFWLNTFSPKDNQNVYETMFLDDSRDIIGYVEPKAPLRDPLGDSGAKLKGPLASAVN